MSAPASASASASHIESIFSSDYLYNKRDREDNKIKSVSNEWINWLLIGIGVYMKFAIFVLYPQLIIHFNSFKCDCDELKSVINNIQNYIILQYLAFVIYNVDYIVSLTDIVRSRAAIFKYLNAPPGSTLERESGANAINSYASSLLMTDQILYILEKNDLVFYIVKAICLLLFIALHIVIIVRYATKYQPALKRCKCGNMSDTPAIIFYTLNGICLVLTVFTPFLVPFLSDLLNKNDI